MRAAIGRGRDAIDYFFELSLFLFVATGFVTVAATVKLDVPSVLLVGAALAVRALAFLGLTRVWLEPKLVTRLTVGYFFFYLFDYLFLSRSFVDATGHLVFFVMVVKLFSARVERDFFYLGLLAFLEMLLAAILTIGTGFLGFFLVFLLFGIATFTSYEIRRAYRRAAHPAEVPGKPMLRGLGATSALVAISTLLLGGVIFFVIPRYTTGYLSRFAPKTQHIAGFSDDVTLGEIGEIKRTTTVVMRVRFAEPPPQVQQLRWRGVALTGFDGRRWFNQNINATVLPGFPVGIPASVSTSTGTVLPGGTWRFRLRAMPATPGRVRDLAYTVLLEPISTEHLFLIPTAYQVLGRFRMLETDANEAVLLRDRSFAAMRYDAVSIIATPAATVLREAPGEYPERIGEYPREFYLQLPQMDRRVAELARQVTAGANNAYDRARLIETYLKTQFGYTLDQPFTGDDPISGFLFQTRRGHCEYFASAMAVMLRALGIPTRMVNGFLPGQYNDISGLYVVRASEAHSWVEVYFSRSGWISFDPTPSAGAQSAGALNRLSLWLDALQSFWIDWVVNYDFSRQWRLARNIERGSQRATVQSQNYLRDRYRALSAWIKNRNAELKQSRAALPALIVVCCAALLLMTVGGRLVALWRRRSAQTRSRQGRATPRDATLAYQRLLHLLARRGYPKSPAMSAREFLPTIQDPALAPLAAEFTSRYESARFGGAVELVPELYLLLDRAKGRPAR